MNQSLFIRLAVFIADFAPIAICMALKCGEDFLWGNRCDEICSRDQATKREFGLSYQCGTSQGLRRAPVY